MDESSSSSFQKQSKEIQQNLETQSRTISRVTKQMKQLQKKVSLNGRTRSGTRKRTVYQGPRNGLYYLGPNKNKIYLSPTQCQQCIKSRKRTPKRTPGCPPRKKVQCSDTRAQLQQKLKKALKNCK